MNFTKSLLLKPGKRARLSHWKTDETFGFAKDDAIAITGKNADRLSDLQYLLYAENRRSVLIILQGMDASGKDGAIRHVMGAFNPQGITVTPFKAPSAEELDHDFLWRIHKAAPAKGDIAVFNRSHYEDVLIARVRGLVPKEVWKARYKQINAFERILSDNGTTVLKFFLHISENEQKERLDERLKDPTRNWKFNDNDLKERKLWNKYRKAYEHMLTECSTAWAPWFVIPADKKWMRNLAISKIVSETMDKMNLKLPPPLPKVPRQT